MKTRLLCLGLVAAALSSPVLAAPVAFSASAGTLGLGLSVGVALIPHVLDTRIIANGGHLNRTMTTSGLTYRARARFRNAALLADYYPFHGLFHITGGVYYDDNRVNLNAQSIDGVYDVNGFLAPAAAVGPVTGTISYNRWAPYLGLGFSNAARRRPGWAFGADLGVMWDRPTTTLSAPGAAYDPALAAELASVQAQIETQANRLKAYPVASLSLGYRF